MFADEPLSLLQHQTTNHCPDYPYRGRLSPRHLCHDPDEQEMARMGYGPASVTGIELYRTLHSIHRFPPHFPTRIYLLGNKHRIFRASDVPTALDSRVCLITDKAERVNITNLSVDSIWNLVHSAVHRHALGRDLRTCANAFRSFRQRPRQVNSNHPIETRHTESALQQRTNSSAHVESRPTNMEAVIYLGEMARVNHRTDLTVPSPTRSSITITRSESKAESIGTSDSRTVSAATSRRASIAGSEVTLGPGGDEDDMQRKIKA